MCGATISSPLVGGSPRLATDDILNPGFEQGLEGWTVAAGDSSGSEQVITDPTRAHSGNNYLQLSTTTAQVVADNQIVAVNPGDQLTFGGWAFLESGSASGAAVGWNLIVRDANGNVLGFPGAGNATSATWTYQSYTYTVPSGGASVGLYAQIYLPTGSTTARFDDGFLTGASGLGVRYYHADHLGSARLMTDASGNQTWSATYLPFGQEWNPQPTVNHYKFTGKERDSESGLDYFGARYDSSQYGRFMTPDPLMASATVYNPQSWNRYAYALNNPLRFIDPDGMKEDSAEACIKDSQCVTVKVNVIYDKKANLTAKQKDKFNNQLLQEAKDEYGDAHIHLDVGYTAGGYDDQGIIQGLARGSINVIVSDFTPNNDPGVSQVNGGYALTQIDINQASRGTLAHELAHDFMGDTIGLIDKIARHDASGIVNAAGNAIFDLMNDSARSEIGRSMPWMRMGLDQRPAGIMPFESAASAFNSGAKRFQEAIRPRQ